MLTQQLYDLMRSECEVELKCSCCEFYVDQIPASPELLPNSYESPAARLVTDTLKTRKADTHSGAGKQSSAHTVCVCVCVCV